MHRLNASKRGKQSETVSQTGETAGGPINQEATPGTAHDNSYNLRSKLESENLLVEKVTSLHLLILCISLLSLCFSFRNFVVSLFCYFIFFLV